MPSSVVSIDTSRLNKYIVHCFIYNSYNSSYSTLQLFPLTANKFILLITKDGFNSFFLVDSTYSAHKSLSRRSFNYCCKESYSDYHFTQPFRGDVGYVNRWTMEITNNSTHYSIPLVVGRRVAQIVFFDSAGIVERSYELGGGYCARSIAGLLFPC
jgi:hypothetical protein